MLLCILGRQPAIGCAELESLYGATRMQRVAQNVVLLDMAITELRPETLGSTMKIAEVITRSSHTSWKDIAHHTITHLNTTLPRDGKVTLGFSVYGISPSVRDIQKLGLVLKQKRKKTGASLRLIPQDTPALNTAQVRHNKLGTSPTKQEVIIVGTHDGQCIVSTTRHVQDIDAYTFRDRARPQRDPYVGMLPPKLAQTMINLATVPQTHDTSPRLLDPFCGTGVILQEAALMGYRIYGTDISEKMVRYSRDNLNWLQDTHQVRISWDLQEADATQAQWGQPIDLVVSETYLGQPFSTEPSTAKLRDVQQTCNTITSKFLQNLAPQLTTGTPVCLAVPAWHTKDGIYRLPLLDSLDKIGYNRREFTHTSHEELIYHREGQIVGRELLVLTRST